MQLNTIKDIATFVGAKVGNESFKISRWLCMVQEIYVVKHSKYYFAKLTIMHVKISKTFENKNVIFCASVVMSS